MSTKRNNDDTSGALESTTETDVKVEDGLFVTSEPLANAKNPAQPLGHVGLAEEDEEADEEDSNEDDEEDSDEDDDEAEDEGEDGDEIDDAEHIEANHEKVMDIIASIDNRYDSSEEQLPNLPAYHPAFKSIEQCRSSIIAAAIHILQTAKYKDAETAELLEQALALQQIKYPRDRKVALIGDSGTGMFMDLFLLV